MSFPSSSSNTSLSHDLIANLDWQNVQDTIKDALVVLSKDLSLVTKELNVLKQADIPTYETEINDLKDEIAGVRDASNSNNTHMQAVLDEKLRSKVDINAVSALEMKVETIASHVLGLQRTLESQQKSIDSLGRRFDTFRDEVLEQKRMDHDSVAAYIDIRLREIEMEFDKKAEAVRLSVNTRNSDTERLEGLYRALNLQIQDIKIHLAQTITVNEFQVGVCTKAEQNDLEALYSDLGTKVTARDVNSLLNAQIKPIGTPLYCDSIVCLFHNTSSHLHSSSDFLNST